MLSLLAYSCWALMDATVKYLSHTYSVILIMGYAGIASLAGPLFVMKARRYSWRLIKPNNPKIVAIRCFFAFLSSYCAFAAFARIPLATGFTLIFLTPFILTLLAGVFLKERIRLSLVICLIVGFAGALVVLRPGLTPISWGMIFAMSCGFSHAISLTILRRYSTHESMWANIIWQQISYLLIAGLISVPHFVFPAWNDLALMLIAGFLNGFGAIAITISFYYAPASRLAAAHYIQLLWGIVCGYLIFGDVPDHWVLLGGALIIGSGFYIVHLNSRLAAPTDTPS